MNHHEIDYTRHSHITMYGYVYIHDLLCFIYIYMYVRMYVLGHVAGLPYLDMHDIEDGKHGDRISHEGIVIAKDLANVKPFSPFLWI